MVKLILLILRFAAVKYVFCLRVENRSILSLSDSLLLVRKNTGELVNITSWALRLGVGRAVFPLRKLYTSDARLFCKNKQENLKNKPKIGYLTEKTGPMCVGRKIQQNEKSTRKLYKKAGRQIRKNKPKMSKFS